jgi:hypothetical protein
MMVSPEALRLQGNFAGSGGLYFVLPLAAGVALHWANTRAVADPQDEVALLTKAFGPFMGAVLLLMARPAVALCLATATLVSSGFIFNETFVYWFPNFAFAAILLVLVTAINLVGRRAADTAQLLFICAAVTGLLGLVLLGLAAPAAPAPAQGVPVHGRSWLLVVPAFIGYDMLRYSGISSDPGRLWRSMAFGLGVAGLLFLVWNAAALRVVAAEHLAQSDIPHLLSARAMAGQTGRLMMGIVGIAGSLAAVHLLFRGVARMGAQMACRGLLPAILGRGQDRPWIAVTGLALLTGAAMALGFAGSEYLDIALRAGLLLWLVFYGCIQWALGLKGGNGGGSAGLHLMLGAVLIVVAVWLAAQDPERASLLKITIFLMALAAGLAWIGRAAAGWSVRTSSKKGVFP